MNFCVSSGWRFVACCGFECWSDVVCVVAVGCIDKLKLARFQTKVVF